MKTEDLKLEKISYDIPKYKGGSHCNVAMWNSFFIPQTKSQLKRYMKATEGQIYSYPVFFQNWAEEINDLMKTQGLEAQWKYTKSKTMARLTNLNDYKKALKQIIK